MKLQVVADNVSNGLRVCSRTGAATVNVIRDLGQLVRKAVGDVGTELNINDDNFLKYLKTRLFTRYWYGNRHR